MTTLKQRVRCGRAVLTARSRWATRCPKVAQDVACDGKRPGRNIRCSYRRTSDCRTPTPLPAFVHLPTSAATAGGSDEEEKLPIHATTHANVSALCGSYPESDCGHPGTGGRKVGLRICVPSGLRGDSAAIRLCDSCSIGLLTCCSRAANILPLISSQDKSGEQGLTAGDGHPRVVRHPICFVSAWNINLMTKVGAYMQW